ncbi:hypothetical protein [Haladaptatus sp. DYF46]|uniref:hypothetical protein n=1 Tax=Haladaptatus sp. DYF46 TaxID=2886041 RepID=UPI001E348B48|nr:hypothetical protein [Haladaptatus sp. DYF46]
MPSRRRILAQSGVALTTSSLGSCLSKIGLAKTGHIQAKVVSLEWTFQGQRYEDQPLNIAFDRSRGLIYGKYDPNIVNEIIQSPTNIVVSKASLSQLSTRFDVKYLIRICGADFSRGGSQGCSNRWTERGDFNNIQLGDRAEVRVTRDNFDIIDVYKDSDTVQSVDVRTFDFAELHKDDGISPDKWQHPK